MVVQWDSVGKTAVKSAASMHYPMELSMAKYCTSGALTDGWAGHYTLGGVVLHHGDSGDAGHYTFLQRQPDSNKWLLYNDANTPESRTPKQVLGFRQLACGFVYHRTPPPRAEAQPVDAAGNTRPPPLYESIPRLCQSESPASSEVPAVVTALTTLPALGTAKHMLSQQQQADLHERQATVTAQRKAAAELKLKQLERQAQEEKAVRRSKREEGRQAEQKLVEGARERQQAAEARKVQRLAREQAAHEQQRKAAHEQQRKTAQAAATQDAARYRAGVESRPTEPPSSQAAPLSKKQRAQARLAAKKLAKVQETAEEAASAAAARQLIDAAAQQQQEAEVAAAAQQQAEADAALLAEQAENDAVAAVQQEASAAQQQAKADAAASQHAAIQSTAAAEQAASQSHMAAEQLLEADLAVLAELASNYAIAAAQQEIEAEASAAEQCLKAAAAAIKQAVAQQQAEAEAAAAAAVKQAAAQQQAEAEAEAAAAKQAAAHQQAEVAAAAAKQAAAQQQAEADAAASQHAAIQSIAAPEQAASQRHVAAEQLLEADLAVLAELAANDAVAAAQQEIEAEASAAVQAAAAAVKQAAAQQQAEVEAAAAAKSAAGMEDLAGSLKGAGQDDAAAVRLKANLPGDADKQAKQTAADATDAAEDQLIKATHANHQILRTRVNDHREVLPHTSTKPRLDEPPPEAGADGSTSCSDPAHVHPPTKPSDAGSPSEQLSHQATEPQLSSTSHNNSVRASQADADSHEPVATSGSGHDSPCSDAGLGNGSSARSVTEQSAAATARAEASNGIRGTLQHLQAEDLFAAWYGAPPPPPPPVRSARQPEPNSKTCAAACLLDQPLITRLQVAIHLQPHVMKCF
ncbi:hypothetical protein ABBQ38_003463 [Trebouxia sp. C0009 RCD-2024]